MPSSPKAQEQAHLAEKVAHMEQEIETLRNKLGDNTQLEELLKRVANCESLAGVVPHPPHQ